MSEKMCEKRRFRNAFGLVILVMCLVMACQIRTLAGEDDRTTLWSTFEFTKPEPLLKPWIKESHLSTNKVRLKVGQKKTLYLKDFGIEETRIDLLVTKKNIISVEDEWMNFYTDNYEGTIIGNPERSSLTS